jgi:predicted DNA-binding protein (MmcQ/YjbR family)
VNLSQGQAVLKARLDAMPGAEAIAITPPRSSAPNVVRYKVMGKMFAILSVKGAQFVILKCDAHLVEILREQYAGIGHRSHLDRRHWICVTLNADVPPAEVDRLADHSYDLVCAGLTRKQLADLRGETVRK